MKSPEHAIAVELQSKFSFQARFAFGPHALRSPLDSFPIESDMVGFFGSNRNDLNVFYREDGMGSTDKYVNLAKAYRHYRSYEVAYMFTSLETDRFLPPGQVKEAYLTMVRSAIDSVPTNARTNMFNLSSMRSIDKIVKDTGVRIDITGETRSEEDIELVRSLMGIAVTEKDLKTKKDFMERVKAQREAHRIREEKIAKDFVSMYSKAKSLNSHIKVYSVIGGQHMDLFRKVREGLSGFSNLKVSSINFYDRESSTPDVTYFLESLFLRLSRGIELSDKEWDSFWKAFKKIT